MPTIIRNCGGGGGADISELENPASSNQVLETYDFYGAGSEEPQKGSIKNYGAINLDIDCGATYSGPQGYYEGITVHGPILNGTAQAFQVLTGATFYSDSSTKLEGTMPNRGAINQVLSIGGSYTNEEGYYESINITAPILDGDAAKNEVLSDKTFYSNSGTKLTGTMPNKGAVSTTIAANGSYSNGAGYYSGINITGPTLNGNALPSDVLSNKTFYSNSGDQKTGEMVNRGSVSRTLSAGASYYGSSGYYSSINISAEPKSNIVSVYTFQVGDAIKNTGITYNSNYYYSAQYESIPSTNSGVNGIKCWASGGQVYLTQATDRSAEVKNVYLFVIKK